MPTSLIPAVPAPIAPPDEMHWGIANETPGSPLGAVLGVDANSPPSTAVRDIGGIGIAAGSTELSQADKPISAYRMSATELVRTDFERAAAYRQTNHESRWQDAAENYLAYSPGVRTWRGSRRPRANMDVHLIFQQVEALIPQIVDAITGNDLDFDVEAARAGTTISQCHMVRDVVTYGLRSLGGSHTRFLGWREVVRRQVKDALIFGNGVNEYGWEGPYTVEEKKWMTQNFPEWETIAHPLMPGFSINRPTGNMLQRNVPVMKQRLVNQFWLDPCPLNEFYIDPSTQGPNVQEGEFAIRRKMMTVAEIDQLRDKPGWNIPGLADLVAISKQKEWTQGDTTRQAMAAAHGVNLQPMEDFSADPRLAKMEVLRYFQRDRHVWVIGRSHAIRDQENEYGALPFFNSTYVDVPGAFYALSIPDICRTDQKLAKALIDGRLDELALLLHPPTITKRGMFRSASQSELYPGANWEADDPNKDVVRAEWGNVTQGAFTEVDSLERRVQAKTGVTDLAVLGVASSGGNSANRTATGVAAQTNASNSRVHYLVANYEDQVVQGILETAWQLTREFMDPNQVMEIIGPAGQQLMMNPADLLNADPRFVMRTAQRMKQRAGLQGGGIQQISQWFLNPEVMTLTEEQQSKVPDIEQISELYCDTFNLRPSSFYRPMTPQEQQAKQQRQQQQGQEKMTLQQARLTAMGQQAQESDETKIMVALIAGLAQAGLLHLASGIEAPIQLEARRLEAEIAGGQMEQAPAQ